jgi:hypothetical protein
MKDMRLRSECYVVPKFPIIILASVNALIVLYREGRGAENLQEIP